VVVVVVVVMVVVVVVRVRRIASDTAIGINQRNIDQRTTDTMATMMMRPNHSIKQQSNNNQTIK